MRFATFSRFSQAARIVALAFALSLGEARAQDRGVSQPAPKDTTESVLLTGTIEGRVIDQHTKQEIIGATIYVLGTDFGAKTDLDGNFKITGLLPKTYQLRVTATDYKPIIRSDVFVSTVQSAKLTIEMQVDAKVTESEEIVVTADAFFIKQSDLKVSANALTQEEIRRAPGAVEDVSRMLLALPGVSTGTDARNDIVVRGGSPIENFIMIEGIEVPNINHFGTQGATGGPIGMLDINFLQDVNFSSGGFSARFGDRLSSVMDIRYREGDRERFRGKFDLGFAGAGFFIEAPIQPGKSAFMLSARKSYLDLIIRMSSPELTAVPNYSNFNLKATFEASPRHRFTALGLGGIDDIYIRDADKDDAWTRDNTRNNGWQYVLGVAHKWLIGSQTFLQTSLSHNQYRFFTTVDSAGVKENYFNNSFEREYLLRSDLSHRFSAGDLLEAGITARLHDNQNEIFLRPSPIPSGNGSFPGVDYNRQASAYKLGAYAQYTKDFADRFSLTLGGRLDYFSYIKNPLAISPRAALSYAILPNLKLNLSGGLYHQAPAMLWLMAEEENRNLRHIEARHLIGGLEYYPAEDIKVTLEVYDKAYRHYPASVNVPELSYANLSFGYGVVGLEKLVSESNGYARGVDFFLQKKLTDNFYAIINYGFSEIRFAGRDGALRPSPFDFRHVFTAIGGWKITDAVELSARWRFVGGAPYTPLDLARSQAFNMQVFENAQLNALRLDDYHRLDLRVDWRNFFGGWTMVSYVELQNVYNRRNPFAFTWNQNKRQPEMIYQWAFLPAGGIKVEF